MKIYHRKDLRALLERAAERAGTMREFAAEIGLSESFLSLVKSGQREPGRRLLAALGLEEVYIRQRRKRTRA